MKIFFSFLSNPTTMKAPFKFEMQKAHFYHWTTFIT